MAIFPNPDPTIGDILQELRLTRNEIRADILELRAKVSEVKADHNEFRSSMNSHLDHIYMRLETLVEEIAALRRDFNERNDE